MSIQQTPTAFFLATSQGNPRLSLSEDGGVTFPVTSSYPGFDIKDLVFDPADTNVVHATSRSAFGGSGSWISIDGGLTWTTEAAPPQENKSFFCVGTIASSGTRRAIVRWRHRRSLGVCHRLDCTIQFRVQSMITSSLQAGAAQKPRQNRVSQQVGLLANHDSACP